MRGDTAAMIRAGHERARRNLHDTWALRRSQPLVTLGLSGLPPTVGAVVRPVNRGSSTVSGRFARVIHRLSTAGGAPSAGRSTRRRIERAVLAVEPGEDQPAADQVGGGHDVGVGDPPGDRPVRLDGERLDLGLDDDVGQPRRTEQGDERRRRPVIPARLAGRRLEAVGVEPVGDDEQAVRVPVDGPRLVVDERREAGGPRPARAFEAQLRAAQAASGRPRRAGRGRRGRRRPRTGRRRPGRSRCRPIASAPAGRPGRRSSRCAARRSRGRRAARSGAGGLAASPCRRPRRCRRSAIGATVALARIRRVPGGTGKTAVDRPAAAQTTG